MDGSDEFDGSDDYITVGDSDNLDITGALTLSAWVRADTLSSGQVENRIILKGPGAHTNNLYTLEADDSKARFVIHCQTPPDNSACTTSQKCVRSTTTLSTVTWYYLVGVFDGTTGLTIYVNDSAGVTNTLTASSTGTGNANTLVIGGRSDSATDIFDGIVDEVRVSNTNRSADWIATEYNNQSSPSTFFSVVGSEEKTRSPNLYLSFDEGYGQLAHDGSGNSADGIIGTTSGSESADPSWRTKESWVFENCLYFDGSDDVVTITNISPIDTQLA